MPTTIRGSRIIEKRAPAESARCRALGHWQETMNILGIETSCDETAAAVVADGSRVLSSVVATQVAVHHHYGGVVPELASRQHIEAIVPVVSEALERAGLRPDGLDAVAATQGPGLVGALLVGFSFAKAYAFARSLPCVGVNHLNGHINSVFLTAGAPAFPFVALLASGGHTAIYYVESHTRMKPMGQTRDDAAGEAFDKVAKMLGLGYPGGRVISELARRGNPAAIVFPRAYLDKSGFDFSFSGLKTAVMRHIQTHAETLAQDMPDIAAAFQEAVVEVLSFKLLSAARHSDCTRLALVGGVAANRRLREKVSGMAAENNLTLHLPPVEYCGDNAAMVAAAGYHEFTAGRRAALDADVYSRTGI